MRILPHAELAQQGRRDLQVRGAVPDHRGRAAGNVQDQGDANLLFGEGAPMAVPPCPFSMNSSPWSPVNSTMVLSSMPLCSR